MIGRIKQRVDFRDRHSLRHLSYLRDLIAGSDLAFLKDAKIKSRPPAGCKQRRHSRFIHPNANPIASNPRLSDLKECAADLKTVADAHGIVGPSFDREVLAKLAEYQVGPLQLLLPIPVRFDLVDEDGS